MNVADRVRDLESAAVGAIHSAFPSAAQSVDVEVLHRGCPECAETARLFAGKRWEEITVDELRGNPGVSLLAPAALRHALPALMLRCVAAPIELDGLPYSVVSTLSPPNGKASDNLAALRRHLTRAQADAVVAFLRAWEARDKMERFAEEAFDSAPGAKVVTRAIAYWAR